MRIELTPVVAGPGLPDQIPCEQRPRAKHASDEYGKREDQSRIRTPRETDGEPQAQNRSDDRSSPTAAEVPLEESAHTLVSDILVRRCSPTGHGRRTAQRPAR